MPLVKVMPSAFRNLETIKLFLVNYPPADKKAVNEIRKQLRMLATFPELGKADEEITGLRVLSIPFGKSGYRVLYKWSDGAAILEVLSIKHDRQAP